MKKNKGITLISLVITIIVLLILASIATYSGINVIKNAQFTRFSTALKITQTKVNEMYESYTNNKTIEVNGQKYTGNEILNIGKDISTVQGQANKVFTANESGITDTTGYKYYDKFLVEALNIEGAKDEEFFINIEKRSVVSYDGMSYEGKNYYTLAQIPDGLYNVEYEESTEKPTFNVRCEILGENKYKIIIEPIYSGYIAKWEVKYQLVGDDYWNTSQELTFYIEKAGNYNIKIENGKIKSEQQTKYLGYVENGLILHYDGIINTRNGSNKASSVTTWQDLSGNKNDGTLNGCSWKSNYLSFDGVNDYVAIKPMDFSNVTLEVVALNNAVNDYETIYICDYEAGGIGLSYSHNKNFFQIYTNAYYSQYANAAIQKNKKYSLSGKYNNKEIVLYENGIRNSAALTGNLKGPNNNTIFCLGTNPNGNKAINSWLNGNIYSVRIYNRALTDEEIKINYEMDKFRFDI